MSNLQEYVEEVSLQDFGLSFDHQAVFNNRLKTTGGTFYTSDLHLAFNKKAYEVLSIFEFRKIVRHELCHYHLFRQNKGYRHCDADFKKLLKQVDGLRYTPKLAPKKYRVYNCQNCQARIVRIRTVDVSMYRCGRCHGELRFESFIEK